VSLLNSHRKVLPSVGILIPLYRSQAHVPHLCAYINELCFRIPNQVVLTVVVDGCSESESAIRKLVNDFRCPIRLVILSRNFGVNGALRAGMAEQEEAITIAFGSDLQEPLELFVEFAAEMTGGQFDFIFGQRTKRDDPLLTRMTSSVYWWINRNLVLRDSPRGGFDVFACNLVARKALNSMIEARTNITSQMLWLGFRRKFIGFERRARLSGKSTWTLRKKFKLFVDSIFAFSEIPFFLVKVLNGSALAFVVIAISNKKFENLWIASVALLLLSFQIIFVVVGRIHESSKQRPQFVIQSIDVFQNSELQ
jgi:glycosyltransferase involved in cell wall biosynthesis